MLYKGNWNIRVDVSDLIDYAHESSISEMSLDFCYLLLKYIFKQKFTSIQFIKKMLKCKKTVQRLVINDG